MKKISLKMIMQRVVLTIATQAATKFEIPALINKGMSAEQALDRLHSDGDDGSDDEIDDEGIEFGMLLRIPGELTASRPWLPALVNSPFSYDLFLSAHHPSSKTLKAKLERWVVGIQIYLPEYPALGEEALIARCRAMVVVLDDGHTSGQTHHSACLLNNSLYRDDIHSALECKTSVINLHELSCAFQQFLTSPHTRNLVVRGLFNTIAAPCLPPFIQQDSKGFSEYDLLSIMRVLEKMPPIEGAERRKGGVPVSVPKSLENDPRGSTAALPRSDSSASTAALPRSDSSASITPDMQNPLMADRDKQKTYCVFIDAPDPDNFVCVLAAYQLLAKPAKTKLHILLTGR
jgi:hypothetical protein